MIHGSQNPRVISKRVAFALLSTAIMGLAAVGMLLLGLSVSASLEEEWRGMLATSADSIDLALRHVVVANRQAIYVVMLASGIAILIACCALWGWVVERWRRASLVLCLLSSIVLLLMLAFVLCALAKANGDWVDVTM